MPHRDIQIYLSIPLTALTESDLYFFLAVLPVLAKL
jgi:hypothetical protein